MYTQIPFTKIVDTLSLVEQKNINRNDFENTTVCLEDIWDNLGEFEKKEFCKQNAVKIFKALREYNCVPHSEIINYVKYSNRCDPEDFLDTMDEDDIADYLETCGYVVVRRR